MDTTKLERVRSTNTEEIADKLNEVIDKLNDDKPEQVEPYSLSISLLDTLRGDSSFKDVINTINSIIEYLQEREEEE